MDELGPFVEFVPVCPEVEVGMSIPARNGAPGRAVEPDGPPPGWSASVRGRLDGAHERLLGQAGGTSLGEALSGYVLKKDSPSCGLLRVKRLPVRRAERRAPERVGQGLFAAALVRPFPHLPIEEEGRLRDAQLRESFIERMFAYHRLQRLWATGWTLRSLIAFHTANKMSLLAHDEPGYRRLGRLVAIGKSLPRAELRERYEAGFMTTLEKLATPGRHVNVMTHMLGHFTDQLDATRPPGELSMSSRTTGGVWSRWSRR